MTNLSPSLTTSNQSNTSLQQCPASLALHSLSKSRPSVGKRDFGSMALLSPDVTTTNQHELLDFPSLEWPHDDDVLTRDDEPERVVKRCLHEALRLLNEVDANGVERPQKRRRMARSCAIPSCLSALETASTDDLFPTKSIQPSILPLRSGEQEKPATHRRFALTVLRHNDCRGKSSDFKENNSHAKSSSFNTVPRTFALNCTISPLA